MGKCRDVRGAARDHGSSQEEIFPIIQVRKTLWEDKRCQRHEKKLHNLPVGEPMGSTEVLIMFQFFVSVADQLRVPPLYQYLLDVV